MKRILTVIVVAALNSICIEAVNGVDSIGCPDSVIDVPFAAYCQNEKFMDLSAIEVNPDCWPEFPGGEEAMQKYIHSHFIMQTTTILIRISD